MDEHFAAEFGNSASVAVWRQKRIMPFCSHACEWVEDVCEVGGAALDCPIFHGVGYNACYGGIEFFTQFDGFCKRFVYVFGQSFANDFVAEDVTAEDVGGLGIVEIQWGMCWFIVDDSRNGILARLDSAHIITLQKKTIGL
ncbi:hypothetical protein DSUL_20463 [Desulfovibrionales bacterium]